MVGKRSEEQLNYEKVRNVCHKERGMWCEEATVCYDDTANC